MIGNNRKFFYTILIVSITLLMTLTILYLNNHDLGLTFAQTLKDSNLRISPAYSGFSSPTGIAFLDNSGKNILVIEKKGDVRLISEGVLDENIIKHFDVNSQSERGLLGIEVMKENNSILVFLYMTINDPEFYGNSSETLRNRVYSFEWNDTDLVNQKLLLDLPAFPGPEHNGGKLTLDKDNTLYAVIGDLLFHETKLENFGNGGDPDLSGSIFRIDPLTGQALSDNPFFDSDAPNIDKTFAYGIRNSFGLAVDPLTGTIWDTENGPSFSDEINIVAPGFNSGWGSIMGPSASADDIENLVSLSQNSKYSEPEVSWRNPIGVTDIEFINSSNLGDDYTDNILVGDHNNGNLYFFKLIDDRSGLDIEGNVIDTKNENDNYVLGTGFGSISDIETGPDGNIYVVSLATGTIFKIEFNSGWRAS